MNREINLVLVRAGLSVMAILGAMDTTIAKNVNCPMLVDVAKSVRCYDKLAELKPQAAAEGKMTASGTEMIVVAKKSLRAQLRKPESAEFTMVLIKTAADGSTAVCGMIDSRNDTDGMTGPKPFVYDGRNSYILISSDGADNGTTHDGPFLDRVFERASEAHNKFCR